MIYPKFLRLNLYINQLIYKCIRISAKYGQGVNKISNSMQNKVCCFGHSGVGNQL